MSAFLPEELYAKITRSIPIICVDIIPVTKRTTWEVGVIVRSTGLQAGKLTVLGGRIYHSETIQKAISRHLKTDLGIDSFSLHKGQAEETPLFVQQYFMQETIDSEYYGFDPTKHSIALTYLVKIDESKIAPRNEAAGFRWIKDSIDNPAKAGFNQHVAVNKVINYLNNL